jgi:hypothetical protein
MKYLTKKSIIKLLENEQARVIDSLQKGIYEFIDESLELVLNKPHIQRLVQDLHDHLYMADKTAPLATDFLIGMNSAKEE